MSDKEPEKTDKIFKVMQLAGVALIIIGASFGFAGYALYAGAPYGQEFKFVLCVLLLVLGIPIYAIGRLAAWWDKG